MSVTATRNRRCKDRSAILNEISGLLLQIDLDGSARALTEKRRQWEEQNNQDRAELPGHAHNFLNPHDGQKSQTAIGALIAGCGS